MPFGNGGQQSHGVAIDPEGSLHLVLGLVHCCVGCRVDDDVNAVVNNEVLDRRFVGDVQCVNVCIEKLEDVLAIFCAVMQAITQLSVGTGDENVMFH